MIYSAVVSRKSCYAIDSSYFTSSLVRRIYAKAQEIAANIRANAKLSVTLRLHRTVAMALILTEQ